MLTKRIISVIVGAPFVIGLILCPEPIVFKLFVVACVALAAWEFFSIVGLIRRERAFAMGLILFHLSYLLFRPVLENGESFELGLLVISIFGFYCLTPKESLEGISHKISMTLLGVVYVGTLGAFVGLLRDLSYGVFWVVLLLAMTWLNDTTAYFAGHKFGKRKLAPKVSPGKTVEGMIGGYFGSFVGFLFVYTIFDNPTTWKQGLILTLLVGTFGPLGDLCESLIKRSFHVKDSGNVIPGHGGMLDRIDALIFNAPVVYFFAQWISGR